MTSRSAFHLDCTPVIPECGFECAKCIEEMESVFAKTEGVATFYREGKGVVVEHDSSVATTEQLMDVFKSLPSFYEGFFIPAMIAS